MSTLYTNIDETEQSVDEWVTAKETKRHECTECGKEMTLYVSGYVQGTWYDTPFDAIFYAGRCPLCGHITGWGQREIEGNDALLLRDRWRLMIHALEMSDAQQRQYGEWYKGLPLQIRHVKPGQHLALVVDDGITRWERDLYLVPDSKGHIDVYYRNHTVNVIAMPETIRNGEEFAEFLERINDK